MAPDRPRGLTEPPRLEPKVDYRPVCQKCGRTLAGYLGRPWSIKCQKCNEPNERK